MKTIDSHQFLYETLNAVESMEFLKVADWLRLPREVREGKGDYTWVLQGDPVSLTLATPPREQCFPAGEPYTAGMVEVQTEKPSLAEAIERVWMVPADKCLERQNRRTCCDENEPCSPRRKYVGRLPDGRGKAGAGL